MKLFGSVTDVPGVLVGHHQRVGDGWRTGVTVVVPPPGTTGSVDVGGGGPGTHETDALDPTTLVPAVDAVTLTGGSAYGLAAAGGVQRWCREQGRGFAVGPPDDPRSVLVPIVPAAAVFDLGRGGRPYAVPDADFGYRAALCASATAACGPIGAGTGARFAAGTLIGGVGTASRHLDGGLVVGALVVANALGSPVNAAGDLYARAFVPPEVTLPPDISPVPADPASTSVPPTSVPPPANTTLAVVVTNARLDPAQCRRTARAAQDGIARAVVPAHTLMDGDTVFALATGEVAVEGFGVVALQAAAADAVLLAMLDAALSAPRP